MTGGAREPEHATADFIREAVAAVLGAHCEPTELGTLPVPTVVQEGLGNADRHAVVISLRRKEDAVERQRRRSPAKLGQNVVSGVGVIRRSVA